VTVLEQTAEIRSHCGHVHDIDPLELKVREQLLVGWVSIDDHAKRVRSLRAS
jgi:hypothetical protein